ncbi:hypothetical protein GN156_05040 [bacterium LRH843]|nr:hypothetical protein [bacterium LRH843]
MEKKKSFVPIPNKMFAFETNYFVSNEELVVFYHLHCLNLAKDHLYTITSVDILNSLIEFDLNNQSRGKKKIKQALLNLHDKGYITLSFSDSKLRNSTTLFISLPAIDSSIYKESVKSRNWKYYGFTEVTDEMYERVKTAEQFRVIIYVEWRSFKYSESKDNYAISFSEWESVLGVSHQTAVKIINNCCDEGIIKKYRGDYYINPNGEIRQYTNKYEVKQESQQAAINPVKEIYTEVNAQDSKERSTEKRHHNWFVVDRNVKLNVDDLYIYLTSKCPVLIEHAKKRLEAICNSESGKLAMGALKEKAERRIHEEEVQKQRDEQMVSVFMDERKVQYNKKKASYDISEILDDETPKKVEEELLSL